MQKKQKKTHDVIVRQRGGLKVCMTLKQIRD